MRVCINLIDRPEYATLVGKIGIFMAKGQITEEEAVLFLAIAAAANELFEMSQLADNSSSDWAFRKTDR